MADSSTSRSRLVAAFALFLACVGLGWFLMAVQTSDDDGGGVARRLQQHIEQVPTAARTAESLSPDEQVGRVLALASLRD
jgi:hypothetical protein